jgi:ABC-type glycerol-3-phosphate transport system permease component
VVLPLCTPVLAALAVINIIWRWKRPRLAADGRVGSRPVHDHARACLAARGSQQIFVGVALATAALAVLPVVVIYIVLQRHIIRGITLTGMRG